MRLRALGLQGEDMTREQIEEKEAQLRVHPHSTVEWLPIPTELVSFKQLNGVSFRSSDSSKLWKATSLCLQQQLTSVVGTQGMADDPEIYEKLTASIAPSIWQQDDIKKGILCQLFGGDSKVGAALIFCTCAQLLKAADSASPLQRKGQHGSQ